MSLERSEMSTIESHQNRLGEVLAATPVVPVVAVASVDQALGIAGALRDAGITSLEVTLRTPCALDALRAMRSQYPDLAMVAGTVLSPEQLAAVKDLGCRFAVSPGSTARLTAAALAYDLPLLAGAATPSETQVLLEAGMRYQKFFPAERSGGVTYLDDIRGPLPDAQFCPTGGIDADNASTYLARANCISVGGSFVVDGEAVSAADWQQVSRHAEAVLRRATGR